MKSKLFLIILGASLAFALVSCGDDKAASDSALKDGTYKAEYSYGDARGYKPFVEIVIEKGKITKVTYDEKTQDGSTKSMDANYEALMSKYSGIGPVEYTKAFAEALLAKQVAPIEAVTGATHSSHSFNALAESALAKAASGDSSVSILPMDETYAAEGQADERGWIGQASVTYQNDKIVAASYDEVQKDESGKVTDQKTLNADYSTMWAQKSPDIVNASNVYKILTDALVASQDPAAVDAVAGASHASESFKTLAAQAIAKRK